LLISLGRQEHGMNPHAYVVFFDIPEPMNARTALTVREGIPIANLTGRSAAFISRAAFS